MRQDGGGGEGKRLTLERDARWGSKTGGKGMLSKKGAKENGQQASGEGQTEVDTPSFFRRTQWELLNPFFEGGGTLPLSRFTSVSCLSLIVRRLNPQFRCRNQEKPTP